MPAQVTDTAVGRGPPELVTVPAPVMASMAVSTTAAVALKAMAPVVPRTVPDSRLISMVNVPPVGMPVVMILKFRVWLVSRRFEMKMFGMRTAHPLGT